MALKNLRDLHDSAGHVGKSVETFSSESSEVASRIKSGQGGIRTPGSILTRNSLSSCNLYGLKFFLDVLNDLLDVETWLRVRRGQSP